MDDRLVPLPGPRGRADALRVAARLSRAGILSMLVPAPGGFDVAVEPGAARLAGRALSGRDEGAYRTAAVLEDEVLPVRARRLAAFFALGVGFGLGHVYAREHLAGLLLAIGQASCLALASWGVEGAVWGFPALMALDAWGAVGAVDRENTGRRRDAAAQLASALPVVALVIATATVLARGAAELRAEVGAPRFVTSATVAP